MNIIKYLYHILTCDHDLEFVRNLYGDPVRLFYGWNRSEWRCKKCGEYFLKPDLYYENLSPQEFIDKYNFK